VCLLGAVSYNKIILRTTFGRAIQIRIGRVEVRRPGVSKAKGDVGDSFTGGLCLVGSPKSGVSAEPGPPTRKPTAEQYEVMQALELTPGLKAFRRASDAGLAAVSKAVVSTRLSTVPTPDHLSSKTTAEGGMVSTSLDEVHVKASRRDSAAGLAAASTRVSTAALPGCPMRGMHGTSSGRMSTAALPGSPMRGIHTVVHKITERATNSDHPEPTAHSGSRALTVTDAGPGEDLRGPVSISPAGLRGFANLSPDEPANVYDPV